MTTARTIQRLHPDNAGFEPERGVDLPREERIRKYTELVGTGQAISEDLIRPTQRRHIYLQRYQLAGRKFGRLKVLHEQASDKKCRQWRCRCDCGKEGVFAQSGLIRGVTLSCGCLNREAARKRSIRHGMHDTPEYYAFNQMHEACYLKTSSMYPMAGARGATVCHEWFDLATFLKDVGRRPGSNFRLVRLDTFKNFDKSNCCWMSNTDRAKLRFGKLCTIDNIVDTILGHCRRFKVKPASVYGRMRNHNMTLEEALKSPPLPRGRASYAAKLAKAGHSAAAA